MEFLYNVYHTLYLYQGCLIVNDQGCIIYITETLEGPNSIKLRIINPVNIFIKHCIVPTHMVTQSNITCLYCLVDMI